MTDTTTTAPADASTPEVEGYGSAGYRAYVLFALIVVYTFNFIDRTLIGVLGEPIRETFGLSDFTIGMLSGLAFAVLYTLLGIPFAMLAERRSRTWIISIAMAAWSAMTVACGMAQNTFQFALARIGAQWKVGFRQIQRIRVISGVVFSRLGHGGSLQYRAMCPSVGTGAWKNL